MKSIENSKAKKKKVIKVLGLVGLFVLVFGLSYALFSITLTGKKKTRISTASFKLELLDKNNQSIEKTNNNEYEYEINLDNALPTSDEEGTSQEGFTFKLKNSGAIAANYTLYLDNAELEDGESRLDDQYVKYSLIKNGSIDYPEPLTYLGTSSDRKLDMGLIKPGETNTYTLKIWIDYDAGIEASNKVFNTVLRVDGTQQTKSFENNTFAKTTIDDNNILEIEDVPNGFNEEKEENGLYKYTDDDGTTTYAFRGTDINNYVTFAGETWRIIRIQEDGTVKLIKENLLNFISSKNEILRDGYAIVEYNDVESNEENGFNKYLNSNIERYTNEWYDAVMKTYGSKITVNEYCSDSYENTENSLNQLFVQNFGLSPARGFLSRGDATKFLQTGNANDVTIQPSISCASGDKVYRKAALVTADEYVLSGGGITPDMSATPSYLNNNTFFWTMSPAGYEAKVVSYAVLPFNSITFSPIYSSFYVRPVIALKSDVTAISGNGTVDNPYVIE